jgi:hypothetical protein
LMKSCRLPENTIIPRASSASFLSARSLIWPNL